MKAAIIAAGDGSRLKSEGIALPKPLVPVAGVPLIERLIHAFSRCGISEVVCIVNEYSLQVKDYIEKRQFGVPVKFIVKTTPSSMHSLFALSPHLQDGRFLLSTVDSVFDEPEFSKFLGFVQNREAVDGVLAVTNFVDDENPLYVQVGAGDRIVGLGGRQGSRGIQFDSVRSNYVGTNSAHCDEEAWVTGGLYAFSPKIFREIDVALSSGIERLRNFLSHLLNSGYLLEAFPFSKIIDIDHAGDIQTAEDWLRQLSKS